MEDKNLVLPQLKKKKKKREPGPALPIILLIQEAKIRRNEVQSQLGK
jgi:hypothetical protein